MPEPTRILILFAHPAVHKSRVHRRLMRAVRGLVGVTFHDLYDTYPDFDVDVPREQAMLSEHDVIVLQHPMYWYSVPALVKQWIDLVLEHGWAYGAQGDALRGKRLLATVSTGGSATTYAGSGPDPSLDDFLLPLSRTASLCGLDWLPPFAIHGAHALDDAQIEATTQRYLAVLTGLRSRTIDIDLVRTEGWTDRAVGLSAVHQAP